MAVRKTTKSGKKPAGKSAAKGRGTSSLGPVPLSVIFGILLLIALITAFFIFLPKVRDAGSKPETAPQTARPQTAPQPVKPPPDLPERPREVVQTPKPAEPEKPAEKPVEKPPTPAADKPAEPEKPVEKPADKPAEKPAETRSRGIYFVQAERAELALVKVDRQLAVSDSPLADCLNALIAGPTAAEKNRGLLQFIPPDTRLLSALVRGNTAYLSFSEEFQYGSHGREGFAAQIRQIVWTATEFPNVNDVQLLIEGKRVDFLSEGVMIGNPIGR